MLMAMLMATYFLMYTCSNQVLLSEFARANASCVCLWFNCLQRRQHLHLRLARPDQPIALCFQLGCCTQVCVINLLGNPDVAKHHFALKLSTSQLSIASAASQGCVCLVADTGSAGRQCVECTAQSGAGECAGGDQGTHHCHPPQFPHRGQPVWPHCRVPH